METHELIETTRARILREGVILCVRLDDDDQALEACRAAVRGGLRVVEVTFTTPSALGIIKELSREPGVVDRPTRGGGRGISLIGQHEILVPLLAAGVIEAHAARARASRRGGGAKPKRR